MNSTEHASAVHEPLWYQEKRTIQKNGNFLGGLMLLLLIAESLVSVGLVVAAFFNGWDVSRSDFGLGNTGFVLLHLLTYVLFLVVPTGLVLLFSRRKIQTFPARRVNGALFTVCVAGGMALAILSNVITGWLVTGMEALGFPLPEFPETVAPTMLSLLLNILSTSILPAFVEEWIFRGVVFSTLRAHGNGVAVVFSAFLFGLFHGNVVQIPFAFLLGLVLAYTVVLTNSIWPAVALHGANNLMSVLLSFAGLFLSDEMDNTLTMLVFLVVTAVGVATLIPMLIHHKRTLPPAGNGLSCFSAGERVWKLLVSPTMIIAVLAMLLMLLL